MMKTKYGYGDKIYTADDLAQLRRFKNSREMLRSHLLKMDFGDLTEKAFSRSKGKVTAYINQSRWMATCDVCGNTMAVNRDDTFFCMNCQNYKNDHQPKKIQYPQNIAEIEKILLKRALPMHRNWTDETVEQLLEENRKAGE